MNLRYLAGLALALAIYGAALAQRDNPILQKRVTLKLQHADLQAAVQALMAQTGAQFVFASTDKPFKPVDLLLNDQPLETAVKYICMSAGAVYQLEEGPVFIIHHQDEEISTGDAPTKGTFAEPVRETVTSPVAPVKQAGTPHEVVKIFLKHAHPEDIIERLTGDVSHPFDYTTDQMMSYQQKNNTVYHTPISQILYGNMPISNQILGGAQPVTPDNGMPSTGPTSDLGTGIETMLGQGVRPGQGGRPGGAPGGPGGQPGQGGGLPANTLIPDDVDLVTYDPTDNSIVVQGPEESIEELRRYIQMFDVRPQQVMIKVEFITATTNIIQSFGIDWSYSRVNFSAGNTPGTFAVTNDPIFVNFASGNIVSRLRASLTQNDGKIVNAPMITTLNNQPGIIQEQQSFFIPVTQSTGFGGGQLQVTTVPQPFQVQSFLVVAPRINRDNTITLTISPTISDITGFSQFPDGSRFPEISTQSISVSRIIHDGETMVLGGLTRKNNTISSNRFPILGDLPIIGQFFRSRKNERQESELLVFVTPTVIPEDEGPRGGGLGSP